MERGLFIGSLITALTGVVAYALLPFTGMVNLPTHSVALLWLTLTIVVVALHTFVIVVGMGLRGQSRPIATLFGMLERKQTIVVVLGSLLFAFNLAFFCMIKPQLGQLVDFSADPVLADIDHYIFGTDPWRLLEWFNHEKLSIIYHRGWFLWLAFVLYTLLKQPASEEKDRLIVSYILMWSIFGPLVHLLAPAAGPVFYDELGLGNRFIELDQSSRSLAVANYLWTGYINKEFNPAGGISAMPSLHLATMFWSIIAVRRSRWLTFSIVFTAYIFVGSIVIGWHYAIDGIVGGVGAVICYVAAGLMFRRRSSPAHVARSVKTSAFIKRSQSQPRQA